MDGQSLDRFLALAVMVAALAACWQVPAAAQEDTAYAISVVPLDQSGQRTVRVNQGDVLQAQIDIQSTQADAEELVVRAMLVNAGGERIVVARSRNASVARQASFIVSGLNPPATLSDGDYLVLAELYRAPRQPGDDPLASASEPVAVETTLTDSIRQLMESPPPFLLPLAIVVLLLVASTLVVAAQYRRQREKRRRYLESINFKTLAQPAKDNAYLGRIAESKVKAYLEFDTLLTHAIVTGATGTGKTVSSQVIVEEALERGIPVIVFDPTAQWTGFLRPNNDESMRALFSRFGLAENAARGYDGIIRVVDDPSKEAPLAGDLDPGTITVYALHHLDPAGIESFIVKTLTQVFDEGFEESPHLKVLLVYDEIHRLLPKFGGSGDGYLAVERAVREFRKWGIGLVLISQVYTDFVGEIQANIGSEFQLRTGYEEDLDRIKTKYGEPVLKSVVKADVGTAMLQHPRYNDGQPYFISFRPIKHQPHRLTEAELEKYMRYMARVEDLKVKLSVIADKGGDVFDMKLELDLAADNVKKGIFNIVDVYLESLNPQIQEYYDKVQEEGVAPTEVAITSAWDEKREQELEGYEGEIGGLLKKNRIELEKREEELAQKERENLEAIESRMEELINRKLEFEDELASEREELAAEADALPPEELNKRQEELMRRQTELDADIEGEKRELFAEEARLHEDLERERAQIAALLNRTLNQWRDIEKDRRHVEESDEHLTKTEEELKAEIRQQISSGVKQAVQEEEKIQEELAKLERKPAFIDKLFFRRELTEEEKKAKAATLADAEERWRQKLEESRISRIDQSRRKRRLIKEEKDKLLAELKDIKEKWKDILEQEADIQDREETLLNQMASLKEKVSSERDHIKTQRDAILKSIEKGGRMSAAERKALAAKDEVLEKEFARVEAEWNAMEDMAKKKKQLEEKLSSIRDQLRTHQKLRLAEEERLRAKEKEIAALEREEDRLAGDDQGTDAPSHTKQSSEDDNDGR